MNSIKKRLLTHLPEQDREGRAVIRMTVKNDDDFLSPFSKGSEPVISTDVAEFIEKQAEALPPKAPLTLYIHGDCIDEGERTVYADAIKAYYTERDSAVSHAFRRNFILSILLAVFGILTLALALLTEMSTESPIWTEVVDIVAWVLLWEAVDVSLFRNHELRESRRRYCAFLAMPILFK